jgi:hypothetical protein
MPTDDLQRRRLDVIFGLFLASGLTVGVYSLWAVANWIHPEGEGSLGLYVIGALSFIPAIVAWLAGGVYMFVAPRTRGVRLGVTLTTAHLVWWLLVIVIALSRGDPSWGWVMRIVTIVEPCLYALGVTYPAARWFLQLRRRGPAQVVA